MVSWKESRKVGDLLLLANGIVFALLINGFGSFYFSRLDLTEEKRYTIKPETKELLSKLEDDVFVEVFLEGDLNPGFTRFQKSIRETLDEFRIYSDNKVRFVFTDPNQAAGAKARNEYIADLASKGISAMNVIDTKDGQRVEKFVFPGALVSTGGFEAGAMLLKGSRAQGAQETLNQSIENIEFELANTIYKLVNTQRKSIAFIAGHGELDSLQIASFSNALAEQYDVFKVNLVGTKPVRDYQALIIAKPRTEFSEQEKYALDQYLMRGGKVLFMLDRLDASMDSASSENYFAFPYELNLDDQLFKYGVRINADLIQDRVSGKYPIIVGNAGNRPQMMQLDWPFFPLINQYAEHPITRNVDAAQTRFVSSIDTVKAKGVKKFPLMYSSPYSRKLNAPVKVGVNDLRRESKKENFQSGKIPIAYLLEGSFTSLFKNRFTPAGLDAKGFKDQSIPTKIIVIADGDLARNDINLRERKPMPLGYDPFSKYTFANQDILLNMVAYLTDENGLIKARNKDVKIRPLDKEKIRNSRFYWQAINIVLPLGVLVAIGLAVTYVRKKRFAQF
jgi:gliding-associated putative ABC transporter substrate-binding component GldG